MQITTGTNWLKLVGATAILGAIVATGVSFAVAPHYVSTAAMSITPQPDPVRPTSPQALEQRAAARMMQLRSEVLSRTSLAETIRKLDLYKSEPRRMPLEDVLARMRSNIRIQARPSTGGILAPIVFSVSFSYPDQVKAQAAVRDLTSKFAEANFVIDRNQGNMYLSFWHDESLVNHTKPAPPPPAGDMVAVLDPASLPKLSAGPNRIVFPAWGLGVGLLVGLVAALAVRWPRGAWQLSAFAAAGFVVAGTASFLIPNRYTSEAVMGIWPAQLTEDPLAPLPAATPAAEFLRRMEPQVLSSQSLPTIFTEDVVRKMRDRDLRISAMNPAAGVSVFSISCSDSNPHRAQQVVQTLVTRFQELYLVTLHDSPKSLVLAQILHRKAGENLEVLDSPSFPQKPSKPNRLVVAAAGFGIGMLLGAITLFLRRPRTPILQPA